MRLLPEEGQPGCDDNGSPDEQANRGGSTVGQVQQIESKQQEPKMNLGLQAHCFGRLLFFPKLKPIPEEHQAADQKQHAERVFLRCNPRHFSFTAMAAIEPAQGGKVTDEHQGQGKKQASASYKNCAQGLLRPWVGKNHEKDCDVTEFLEPSFKRDKRGIRPKDADQKEGIEQEDRPVLRNNVRAN